MSKRAQERDPMLWQQAKRIFEETNAGCYVTAEREERETVGYYRQLLRKQERAVERV